MIRIWVSLGPEPQVKTMEDLVNQERTIAENYLNGQGVLFLCEEEHHDTVKEGYVIRTDPEKGQVLTDGQTVKLFISKGPEIRNCPMPNVVGQRLETARTIINNQKPVLVIKEVEETSNTVQEGYIIRTEPATNENVKTGDTITLYVSTGPKKAKMPALRGEDIATALKMLNAAGFTNITYEEYVESEEPLDTVVEQSVEAGEEVAITTTVVLKLSEGPKPQEVTKMVSITLPEGALEAYTLKFIPRDPAGKLYQVTVSVDETEIKVPLTGTGTVTYDVTIGDEQYTEIIVNFNEP